MTRAEQVRRVMAARRAVKLAGGLMTTADLARDEGVTIQAMRQRAREGKLPEPIAVVGGQNLFVAMQFERKAL